jgi:hypothetical protein
MRRGLAIAADYRFGGKRQDLTPLAPVAIVAIDKPRQGIQCEEVLPSWQITGLGAKSKT